MNYKDCSNEYIIERFKDTEKMIALHDKFLALDSNDKLMKLCRSQYELILHELEDEARKRNLELEAMNEAIV